MFPLQEKVKLYMYIYAWISKIQAKYLRYIISGINCVGNGRDCTYLHTQFEGNGNVSITGVMFPLQGYVKLYMYI
jgi:hypothetical protein